MSAEKQKQEKYGNKNSELNVDHCWEWLGAARRENYFKMHLGRYLWLKPIGKNNIDSTGFDNY